MCTGKHFHTGQKKKRSAKKHQHQRDCKTVLCMHSKLTIELQTKTAANPHGHKIIYYVTKYEIALMLEKLLFIRLYFRCNCTESRFYKTAILPHWLDIFCHSAIVDVKNEHFWYIITVEQLQKRSTKFKTTYITCFQF